MELEGRVAVITGGAVRLGKALAYLDQLAQNIPARRVGSAAEIAKTLVYLLKSDFVTGETLFVTGGEHLV